MRVLIAPDHLGLLPAGQAATIMAEAWSGHDVVALPLGEAGQGWLQSVSGQLREPVSMLALDDADGAIGMRTAARNVLAVAVESGQTRTGIDACASSAILGRAVSTALADGPRPSTLAIDVGGLTHHDAGAGFLQALGAVCDADVSGGVASLTAATSLDLEPVRRLLAGCELVGVVPSSEATARLLGLRGISSLAGREANLEPEQMLAADAALEHFVGLAGPDAAAAAAAEGAGAAGGLGWAILALGGRLVTGPGWAEESFGMLSLAQQADLIVTGCASFDFASRGGGVVAAMAKLGEDTMTPCIVVAGSVLIGAREMRTMGIEAAYAAWSDTAELEAAPDPVQALREVSARVARTWSW